MKTLKKMGLLAIALGCCGLLAATEDPTAPSGSGNPAAQTSMTPTSVVADKIKLTAVIQEIDPGKREIKLKGNDGNTLTLSVSPEAQGYENVRVGDRVQVSYLQSVALSIQMADAGGPAPAAMDIIQVTSLQQSKPEIATVKTDVVASTVENVDQKKSIVTLRTSEGDQVKLKADENIPQMQQIKPGDKVLAQYTEPIAIEVKKLSA